MKLSKETPVIGNWRTVSAVFCIVGLLLRSTTGFAQFSEPDIEVVKGGQYVFPIRPGNPASLSGTMGELRSTHFHTGLDIRTNNEIGWPVIAVQNGYISRGGVSPTGFGNVLYVKHPDGNTTVYGHLDRFSDAVGDYILKERYRRKSSSIDLYFREGQFPVKKGDTIAFAGNSGSSGGPHLHFDVRDPNNLALNPLKYGFNEVRDNTPPVATKIAFKTLDINSRINDRFGRFEFYLQRSGSDYLLSQPILASGTIGFELLAHDVVDNARFKCGVNTIEVYVDSVLIFRQNIEQLNLTQGRTIYTVMDFKKLTNEGTRFYRLYQEDGNNLRFYSASPGNGKLKVNPTKQSHIKIVMKDFHGNTSTVRFRLKPSEPVKEIITLESAKSDLTWEIEDNTMVIASKSCDPENQPASLYLKGTAVGLEPAYYNSTRDVYLIDLRKALPDSIILCDKSIVPGFKAMVPSGTEYKYYSDRMDIRFPDRALYDTLYFIARHEIRNDSMEIYSLGPLAAFSRGISVTLKPAKTYPNQKATGVYRVRGKSYSYEGGEWSQGKLTFYPRETGDFTILTDTVPPSINRIYVNSQAVRFRISDNLSGIASYEANINGKWLLLNYDAKTGIIVSERLNSKELLKGDFELTVTDQAGNKKTYTQKIP
ncbi:MAG: M23 family metallopeptidase [Cyclobacteriaceae bacterium]|nr:M23 family metallopeptidase [Cyclobacteriaceae bacterium]UYN88392.1 MAG: M23 family metallopeptidase [Cyclobacteriaceae bacterium]